MAGVSRMKEGFLVRVGAMEEKRKFRVEKFNNQNYQLWNMQMEDYLYQKDLFLSLGRKAKQLETMTNKEWDVLDSKVLGILQFFQASSVAFNISKEKTMEGVMSAFLISMKTPLLPTRYF